MILGISAFYHDAAAAVVDQGNIIAFSKEERFTHIKHNSVFPKFAIAYCLEEAGIAAKDLDEVVFYEEPSFKFSRIMLSLLADFPASYSVFIQAMKIWLTDKLWVKNTISRELDIHPNKISFLPHHLSHIGQAFLPSPFEEAAFMTLDAVGEWTSISRGWAKKRPQLHVEILNNEVYPHSLGLFYATFTTFLGFQPNSQEGNTMALAAFGKPTYYDQVKQLIHRKEGKFELNSKYFNFYAQGDKLFNKKFLALFGQPRTMSDLLAFDVFGNTEGSITVEMQRYADIAASVQLVLEEIILEMAIELREKSGLKRLCLAGGVALNAVAIGRLIRESGFEEIYVPADPGDGGAAFGAALYKSCKGKQMNALSENQNQAYLGKSYSSERIAELEDFLDLEDWEEYQMKGIRKAIGEKVHCKRIDDLDQLIEEVSDKLMDGQIVGWYQGKSESGPRALGNRSILARPDNLASAKRLSNKVKSRAPFRPYALSVTEEDCFRLFDFEIGKIPHPARWMQMVSPVKEEAIPQVAAAVHIDGTTRPQVCSQANNPAYHKLLEAFGEKSGLAALLNTSFNESGYPIANSPEEALIVFARTEMDCLVINNLLLQKTYESIHTETKIASL